MAITKNEDTGISLFGLLLCALGGIHVFFGRIEIKGSVYRVETEPFAFWFTIGTLMVPGAICAIVGLVMMLNRRRKEQAKLSPQSQTGFLFASAFGFLLILALAYLSGDKAAREKDALDDRVGPLFLGMSQEEIQDGNPNPDLMCPQNRKMSLWSPGYGMQTEIWTAETWVYRVRESDSRRCGPDYEDTEIGWDQNGAIIWYSRHSGESGTVFAEPP